MTETTETIDGEAVEIPDNLPVPADTASPTLFRTDDPAEIVRRATEVADELSRVLINRKLTKRIQQKDHVLVEGWTLLGTMLGVFPVVVWTRQLENGWEARVEARTRDGAVVGAAEAECLRSEKTWSSRDDYALRSMAQTRATSKALRGPLGFVVTLAGFEATPAEEMPNNSGAGDSPSPAQGGRPQTPPPANAPDLPASFPAGGDLAQRIGEALKHVDPSVDWLATWDNAIHAAWDTDRKSLTKDQNREAWTRLAIVADKLTSAGDFPPPGEAEILAAFEVAFVLTSVIRLERHEPADDAPLTGPTPAPDDQIEFGDE